MWFFCLQAEFLSSKIKAVLLFLIQRLRNSDGAAGLSVFLDAFSTLKIIFMYLYYVLALSLFLDLGSMPDFVG